MASLNIEHDEDIYEGKLYGWRWFMVIHGLWILTPPMFSVKRSRDNQRARLTTTSDSEEYFRLLHEYYYSLDLFDWNQSDVPPDLARFKTQKEFVMPTGHASGFHLFADYDHAVNYALVPYTAKQEGVALPQNPYVRPTESITPHLRRPDGSLSLKVTPVLAFVEASGAIVEHELGYRAHLIRVVSLYSDGRKRARRELADNIGWPGEIHKFRKLRKMENPSDTQLRRLDCD
jgi:hypothetical protein